MRIRLAVLLLLPGCAWITERELTVLEQDCECPDGGLLYYPDRDGDGYGDMDEPTTCPEGEGWLTDGDDCDDGDPDVHPDADEYCNDADDDCDGVVDNAQALDALTWYQDLDGDGYGDPDAWTKACTQPSGYVDGDSAIDCDDTDHEVHPEATEICDDGKDNDCDGDPSAGDCRMSGSYTWDAPYLRFPGQFDDDGTGLAAAGGVELTGDGSRDVVLGAPGWRGYAEEGGGVFIQNIDMPPEAEPADMNFADAKALIYSDELGANFGRSLTLLGDHDGAGEPWLAVGSLLGSTAEPAVHLIEGPFEDRDNEILDLGALELTTSDYGESFGAHLAGGLDATDGGLTDLAVAAPDYDSDRGAVLLWNGPVSDLDGSATATATLVGEQTGERLGADLALVPDIDGDGLAELLVGAELGGDDACGRVDLFLSPVLDGTVLDDRDQRYEGELADACLHTTAAAGDVDGDGLGDVLLGAPQHGSDLRGKAYLLLGAATMGATLDAAVATFEGSTAGGGLGADLTGLSDFDGDGHADLLIGAPYTDSPGADAGAVYLFHGPLEGGRNSNSADATVLGVEAGAWTGSMVVEAGDIHHDGRSDVLIGAPGGSPGQVALLIGHGW